MSALLKPLLRTLLDVLVLVAGLPFLVAGYLRHVLSARSATERPRLVWQSTPIKSLSYMARAMAERGYLSETAVTELYAINRRKISTIWCFQRSLVASWPTTCAPAGWHIAFSGIRCRAMTCFLCISTGGCCEIPCLPRLN